MNFVDDPESAVLAAAKDMLRRGLVEGTAGNISARRSDGNVVITPSSVDYAEMLLHDLVLVDAGGAVLHAKDGRSPSTELNLHLACYRAFDDIGSTGPAGRTRHPGTGRCRDGAIADRCRSRWPADHTRAAVRRRQGSGTERLGGTGAVGAVGG